MSADVNENRSNFLRKAEHSLRSGDFEAALAFCRKGTELFPETAVFIVLAGVALISLDRREEAEALFRCFIRDKSVPPKGYPAGGQVYTQIGNLVEYLGKCLQVAASGVRSLRPPRLQGRPLMELGGEVETEGVFRDLIAQVPDETGAHLGLAKALAGIGAWGECAEVCAASSERRTPQPHLLGLHGKALVKLGRFDAADKIFRELMERTPNSPVGYLGAARVAQSQNNWSGCTEVCSQACAKLPAHPQITKLYAQALLHLRRFDALQDLLSCYFQKTGILNADGGAGPTVNDRRFALSPLFDLYWKAMIGLGDYDAAKRFRCEISCARTQGRAMVTLYGGFAPYVPFYDNSILGDI